MSVIIISRGSYSHGSVVAEKLAQQMGYECISRDILIEISHEFNIPKIKLIRAICHSPSALEPYTFAREKYIAFIRSAILDHLSKDNTVYHGFAGHFFVKDIPHVLKVRIIADMDARIKCMMTREQVSDKREALKMVKQVDEERRAWSMKLYGIDTWDSRLYDLVIRINKITVYDAVKVIYNAVSLKPFQTTPESFYQMEQSAHEAREQLKKLSAKSSFLEPLRESPWRKKF
jgi:cytidylate kinase